ncbi:MAG TPA: DMT family transporter [Ktedonobacterales bacterium]|jgi:drug/metabolite transporter (DMT)-like permease|nr:DMT family transporter [Ktedonobacterales bacterium]
MRRWLAMGALASAAALWGLMYVISRVALQTVPALPLVVMRVIISLVCLAPFAVRQRFWRVTQRQLGWLALVGLTGYTCSLSLQFIGTALTSASLGSLITSAAPAFIVLFAALGGERPSTRTILALAFAMAGVALIVGVDVPVGGSLPGILALVGAAVSWALYTVLGRHLARDLPLLTTLFWGLMIGGLAAIPLAAPQWPSLDQMRHYSPTLWLEILYLGVVAMAVAFYLWNYGFAHLPSDVGAVFGLFQPLVGVALGAALLGERMTTLGIVGALGIVAGAALAGIGGAHEKPSAAQSSPATHPQ